MAVHEGNEVIRFRDSTFASGGVGLRVVGTETRFAELRIEPMDQPQ